MNNDKLELINKCWEHKKAQRIAHSKEMIALHRIIADPARAEEFEQDALRAADEHVEAGRLADLAQHELNEQFPGRWLEEPVAGAWKPIIELMAAVLQSRQPETKPPESKP